MPRPKPLFEPQRLSLALEPTTVKNLEFLREREHLTITDTVRRAVAMRRWFYEHLDAGHKLAIILPDGTVQPAEILL